jgi:hypothetical protein
MKLPDLFNRKTDPALRPTRPPVNLSKVDRVAQQIKVWANPTAYNRATRRAFGVRGRISPFAAESVVFVPRYARRHWGKVTNATRPYTRRVRKQRARVGRAFVAAGMAR